MSISGDGRWVGRQAQGLCCVLRQVQEVAFKVGTAGGCDQSVAQIPRNPAASTPVTFKAVQCSWTRYFWISSPALVCVWALARIRHPPSAIDDQHRGQAHQHPIPYITAALYRPSFIRSLSAVSLSPDSYTCTTTPSPWLSPTLSPALLARPRCRPRQRSACHPPTYFRHRPQPCSLWESADSSGISTRQSRFA